MNDSSIDLFYLQLGSHTFGVEAADVEGNQATSSVAFRIVTNPVSTVLDVERAFSLGWIKKKNIKDALIKQIRKACPTKKIDKKQGKQIIKELDKQLKKGGITQDAYNVIKPIYNGC